MAVETFKFSTDPELVAKVTDVVGLYLAPPENAIVLCVDEKSQIQALDRTAPMLPMQPGLPARRTHDYKRHGTTTLFAALEIATGKVTAACKPRHRHQEFLAFLKQVARAYPDDGTGAELHLVMDNYAAHKRLEVRTWLAANPGSTSTSPRPPDPGSTSSRSGSGSSSARRSTAAPSTRSKTSTPRSAPSSTAGTTAPPLRLDQDRRRDPQESQPSEHFKHGPLVMCHGGRETAGELSQMLGVDVLSTTRKAQLDLITGELI